MPAATREEALDRELRAQDHAVHVDVDDALGGRVALLDEQAERHDPGVVDQDIERPQPLLDLIEERGEALPVGDVERQADRAGAELGRGLLGELLLDVPDRDARALREQRLGRRAADPASTAGDRNRQPGERAWNLGHVLPPPSPVGALDGTGSARPAGGC